MVATWIDLPKQARPWGRKKRGARAPHPGLLAMGERRSDHWLWKLIARPGVWHYGYSCHLRATL